MMFQFHKVQLKESEEYATALLDSSFQFHKVQLKEEGVNIRTECFRFQFHKVQLKGQVVKGFAEVASFQFHKVQLKAFNTKTVRTLTTVSIP
mgnify:CR=1 FL=1